MGNTFSACGSRIFILVRAGVLSGLTGLKGYIFCGVQIILCALCSSTDPDNPGLQPALKRGILKFLWILTTLDSLFVILYSLILRSLLDKYGIPLTSFYVPGLISMTAPVLAGIIYWVWSRSSERMAYHKLRVCATLTAAAGIAMVILGITGFNKSFSMVELYPYWLGALQLVLAFTVHREREWQAGDQNVVCPDFCAGYCAPLYTCHPGKVFFLWTARMGSRQSFLCADISDSSDCLDFVVPAAQGI